MLKVKKEIEKWLMQHSINDYVIQNDLTVDVNTSVFLNQKSLTKIPIQFGIINGGFFCVKNNLTSLKGSPHTVKGPFHCGSNNLINLTHSPKIVEGDFNCMGNPIKTIEGFNSIIDGFFVHSYKDEDYKIKEFKELYKKMEHEFFPTISIPGKDLIKLLSYIDLREAIVSGKPIFKEKTRLKI